ncbi:hypothetical protein Cni_G25746 [Canna indica]|uniref:Transposase n=1 Tax=Canna indica TaxID=4628 RepID=A0AAQ3L1P1_9LILI|nr:hypothetical protein Cni_G25746 [Canna indica]
MASQTQLGFIDIDIQHSERDGKSNTNTVPARDNVAGEEEGIHSEGDVVISESDDEWYQNIEDDENEGDSESNLDYADEEERNDGSESDQLDESYDQIVNVNSNEEIYIDRVMRGKIFERAADGRVQLENGLLFLDVNEFREALQDYTIQEGFEIQRIKNEKARVTARCAINGCTWRIHASPTPDGVSYKIKTYNPDHNCIRTIRNSNANSTWIAKRLQSKLVADPEMSYCSMKAELLEKYGLEPANNMQLYRARRRVKEENQGNHAKSYDKLPAWAKLARVTNPGSVVKMEVDARMSANPLFKRFFVCFDAMKKGFVRGCRPWFGIDGCHLKGTYGGVLLSAVAIDGNKGMFPIAFAVVEVECIDSWKFFLRLLYESLASVREWKDHPLTIMSDMQKGLGSAVSEFFPYAKHRYCCHHLLNNFKLKFKSLIKTTKYWTAAKAYNNFVFEKNMMQLRTIDNEAADWLLSPKKTYRNVG